MPSHFFSWNLPKPEKTAAVIRYGAFGDVLQTASILPALKKQGFHITYFCTPRGVEVIENDPHIDRFVIQEEDAVPNHELRDYFKYLEKTYTKVINMCETVEGIILPGPDRAHFYWPKEARHRICNQNYVEQQHLIAGVPYNTPEVRFYETKEEKAWALRELPAGLLVAWVLTGSAAHKIWPHVDDVITDLLKNFPDITIALLGGPKEQMLEGDWDHPRVLRRVGRWPIRNVMAFAKQAEVVVGPETGVLNAMAMEDMAKVLLLSHSTVENLSRDWVNTTSLAADDVSCYPCHQLHLTGWQYCNRHPKGTAACQYMIGPERVYEAIAKTLREEKRKAA